jgi:hypothetical protein
MNRSRIQIAKTDIVKLFDEQPLKVLRQSDLARILTEHGDLWRLTQDTTTLKFIKFLMVSAGLSRVVFPFPKPYPREIRYSWGDVDLREVMLTLKPRCHFSHYTAMQIHGLTEQVPKTTYLNFEQALASNSTGELVQKSIDIAFARAVRTTNYIAETDQFRVCLLNGRNTGYLGVEDYEHGTAGDLRLGRTRVTNVERTLIDIAVRPVYSGGVSEVLKAYRRAKEKVSVNKLAAMLKQLKFIYPYHQVVGFYLDRAGYKPSLLDLLRQFPMEFDFYLEHQMKKKGYVKAWRLYVPEGF